jgi:mono/diheme cytochrome c family protein
MTMRTSRGNERKLRQRVRAVAVGAAAAVWAAAVGVTAQQPRTVWDGVYTAAQAERGQAVFSASCLRCHGSLVDGVPRRFTGDKFWASWGEDSLGSLFGYLRQSMPNDAPGSLPVAAYTDLLAYLVSVNGAPAGAADLTVETIAATRLTRRSGDGALPEGALVAVVGCLTRAAQGFAVTHGTVPARDRTGDRAAQLAQAADVPLGDTTFALLYPTSPLDTLVGQRVLVRGLLVRRPSDGVNVMSVQATTSRCERE